MRRYWKPAHVEPSPSLDSIDANEAGPDYEVNSIEVSGVEQGAIGDIDAEGRVNAPPWLLKYFLPPVYCTQSRDYISYSERS